VVHPFDFLDDDFDTLVVAFGIVRLFEVAAEEERYGLVKTCRETALVILDDIITVVAGLAVDQFHQDLSLIDGHLLQRSSKLLFQFLFTRSDIGFSFAFRPQHGEFGIYIIHDNACPAGIRIGYVYGISKACPFFYTAAHGRGHGGGHPGHFHIPGRDDLPIVNMGRYEDGIVGTVLGLGEDAGVWF